MCAIERPLAKCDFLNRDLMLFIHHEILITQSRACPQKMSSVTSDNLKKRNRYLVKGIGCWRQKTYACNSCATTMICVIRNQFQNCDICRVPQKFLSPTLHYERQSEFTFHLPIEDAVTHSCYALCIAPFGSCQPSFCFGSVT